MAPSKLGPLTVIQDNPPMQMEVFLIRLPLNMSFGDTTNPTNWEGTGLGSETGERVGEPHSCVVLNCAESDDASLMKLELLVMRSFGHGGRATARQSGTPHPLLPLPYGEPPFPTPVGFGAPLQCPRFEPLKETWLIAQVLKLSVPARSMVRKYVPRAAFTLPEIARVRSYMMRLAVKPVYPRLLTPTTGSHLNSASVTPPGSSSVSQAYSPSHPQAVLVKGTTAQTRSHRMRESVHRNAADKAAADKAAAEKAAAKNHERIYDEEDYPRYVGPDKSSACSSPIMFYAASDYSVLEIPYLEELADETWSDFDENRSSSLPPPIPFLVDWEAEEKVRQSNEAVELWLSKI